MITDLFAAGAEALGWIAIGALAIGGGVLVFRALKYVGRQPDHGAIVRRNRRK